MTLDEYVRETLLAIVRGVAAAQADQEHGEHVGRAANAEKTDYQGNVVTRVAFDLATTSEDKGSAGGGITVIPFFTAKGEVASAISSANRLQFSVPVSIPKPEGQREADAAARNRENAAIRNRPRADF